MTGCADPHESALVKPLLFSLPPSLRPQPPCHTYSYPLSIRIPYPPSPLRRHLVVRVAARLRHDLVWSFSWWGISPTFQSSDRSTPSMCRRQAKVRLSCALLTSFPCFLDTRFAEPTHVITFPSYETVAGINAFPLNPSPLNLKPQNLKTLRKP